MNKFHDIKSVRFEIKRIHLDIDGKKYQLDLSTVSKRLENASEEEKMNYEVSPSGYGIHWQLIDEDLSIDGLLGIKHSIPSKVKAI